jgi:hypothetical protein
MPPAMQGLSARAEVRSLWPPAARHVERMLLMASAKREPAVPKRVREAVRYMLEVRPDLVEAATHAGMRASELRREMEKAHVRRFSLEQRQLALQNFILGSPKALTEIRDTSPNAMARVAAIKCGELLQQGALADEAASTRRSPDLTIVVYQPATGEQHIAHTPSMPLIDAVPATEAEPLVGPDEQ